MRRINGLLQAGDFHAAHDRLQEIVDEHADYVEAQRLLGGVTLVLGDVAGAERILRRAIECDPDWTPTLATLGELLLGSGRVAEAETFLQRAITGQSPSPQAALVLARYYNDRRQHAQALAVIAPFCRDERVAPDLAVQHATALVALGRGDDAVAWYRAIAARSPDNTAAAQALAIALQALGRHAEAASIADQAVRNGPKTAALCYAKARSLVALGAFDRAEAALRDCLRMEPQHAEAHGDLARLVWMRSGDSIEATAELDRALHAFSGNDALWAAKAAVLQGAGDARAAYACLAPRIERPQAPPALQVRAGLAALEFDPRIALERAERALQAVPNDVAARTLQVAALLGVGAADAALPVCGALRSASPDDQYLIALQTTAWRLLGDERYLQLCDYRDMVVPYRLEAPPAWNNLGDFVADLKRSLDTLHDALRHPLLFQSLRHGTETTNDLTRSEDPVIRALFGAFDAPIRDYITRMGEGTDPLRRRNAGTYHFNGSWSVRLHGSGFHHNHVHPRGWISSACYIDLPEGMEDAQSREGVLTFGEPGILTTPVLRAEYEVRPKPGMLVLFPSYFWHGTVPFQGERTRLTVAFDAVPG
ncbi:MAG: tetratricopeptide repeat protein [Xanthomonadaceae bacterium]|nr:tetratricopeptide repeat protein [Xanthomonadaceae bacterium]